MSPRVSAARVEGVERRRESEKKERKDPQISRSVRITTGSGVNPSESRFTSAERVDCTRNGGWIREGELEVPAKSPSGKSTCPPRQTWRSTRHEISVGRATLLGSLLRFLFRRCISQLICFNSAHYLYSTERQAWEEQEKATSTSTTANVFEWPPSIESSCMNLDRQNISPASSLACRLRMSWSLVSHPTAI